VLLERCYWTVVVSVFISISYGFWRNPSYVETAGGALLAAVKLVIVIVTFLFCKKIISRVRTLVAPNQDADNQGEGRWLK